MRIVFLTCLLLAPQTVFAQSAPPTGTSTAPMTTAAERSGKRHAPLKELDLDGDGMISRQEAQQRRGLSRRFDQIDTNHDGQLDRGELRAWHQQMKAQREQRQQTPSGSEPTMPPPGPPAGDSSSGG